MKNSLTTGRQGWMARIAAAASLAFSPGSASAAVFGGDENFSILGGLNYVGSRLSGTGIKTDGGLRELILSVLVFILNYVTLFAMVTVVVAGLYLIFSNGDEGNKDKAKKIVIYTVIGLVVILLSRVIVMFFNSIIV